VTRYRDGGMSRRATWSQALADVTGRTVLVRELGQVSRLAARRSRRRQCESALHDLEPARYTPDVTRYVDLQRSAFEGYCRLYAAGQAQSGRTCLPGNEVDVHASPY